MNVKTEEMIKHDLNLYWRKRLIYTLIILFVLFMCFLLSCNSEKALIRKQDKAYGITVSTPRTFAQAAATWLAIHPCITPIIKDSTIIKHDTITTEKKVFIPVLKYKSTTLDTIVDGISIYADSMGITVKNLEEKEVTTKTIYQTKVDQTRVNNLTDTLNAAKLVSATKDGIIETLRTNVSDNRSENKHLWWYLVAAGVILILSHVLRSYLGGWVSSATSLFKKS
jgi:hypothetical protein